MSHAEVTDGRRVSGEEPRVMGAIDAEGGEQRYVIADVSRDDAWIASDLEDSRALDDWA